MRNLFIGALKVHDSQSAVDMWLQIPIQGLDSPDTRLSIYDKPGEDGAVVSSMFYGSRTITLNGFIKGSTPTAFETNRQQFIASCAQQKDSFGQPVPTRVTFTTIGGSTYYVDGYIKRPVMDIERNTFARYMVDIVVPGPAIFNSTQSSTVISRAIGGGAIVPFIVPVILAPSSGGTAAVVNNGSVTSYPLITLTGPLTNPYLANSTVGKSMQLNYTINSGDSVVIDMLNKTIMLNGTTSLLSAKTSDSDWWGLVAGSNNINFSTGTSADTGTATITYNDAYLGV